ncbi:uncharacterized protein [Triticum aestivum]|uniref:uncharacterized protein n=1 Tax=Triticum aestivum TaxID=4565 RepID=UPI001D02062A|nr:uncharacterized protein LOC123120360 [Triticum aestivum]
MDDGEAGNERSLGTCGGRGHHRPDLLHLASHVAASCSPRRCPSTRRSAWWSSKHAAKPWKSSWPCLAPHPPTRIAQFVSGLASDPSCSEGPVTTYAYGTHASLPTHRRTVNFAEEEIFVAQCHEQQRSGDHRFAKGFSAAIEGQYVDGDANNEMADRSGASNGEDVDRQQQHPPLPSAAMPQCYSSTKPILDNIDTIRKQLT